MSNLNHFHPFSIHFPIALIITGFAILSIYMLIKKQQQIFNVGLFLVVAALAGMGIAYISGEYFTAEFSGELHELKEVHEFYAKLSLFITLGGVAFWIIFRKKKPTLALWVFYIAVCAATVFILYTGYLGGSLVYDKMIPRELLR